MKILISPAKSIALTNKDDYPLVSSPCFLNDAQKLVKNLKKLKVQELKELMNVSEDIAQLNRDRFKNWSKTVELTEHSQPCSFIFSGEVYRALDISSLNTQELLKAQEQLMILSGLYGILKPLDLIYPYRLEMGTKWSPNPDTKNLYAYWNDKLTKHLRKNLVKDEVVVDLASTEYSKVVNWKIIKNQVVVPVFKEFKNGDYKVVMMYAKHARGKMSRYLIQNNLNDIEQLKLYNQDGYTYDDKLSNEKEWVFVR